MRLSQAIVLYLAAAAPFGAAFFLRRRQTSSSRALSLASAALAALAWPLTAPLLLRADSHPGGTEVGDCTAAESKVARAKRVMAASLAEVEGLFESAAGRSDEGFRYVLFAARESVERFVGLALAAEGASPGMPPADRELELCRVAGRTGEDLLLAGRCIHRRNVLRLLLHRERARNQMLHALSEVREAAGALCDASPASPPASREISGAIIRAYEPAIEILSTLGDRRAAEAVSRLLDAERARLSRLVGRDSVGACAQGAKEVVTCTTQAAATASATSAPHKTITLRPD